MGDFSQCGETEILRKFFEKIGTKNKHALEFGAGDGFTLSNIRGLIQDDGWKGIMWDIKPRSVLVCEENVTPENINQLCKAYNIDADLDLISIDIDGNDYWVWKALTEIKPRVVIIEFNHNFWNNEIQTIEYDKNFNHDLTDYYGATYNALKLLGEQKGYELVWNNTLNMIFIDKNELIDKDISSLKHFQDFKNVRGWPNDPKKRKWHKLNTKE